MKHLVRRIGMTLLLLGMLGAPGVRAAERVAVFVSILPQKYFVEKIGGHLVEVSVMVPPGASPATYEPKPKQMVALSKAKIYFAIGVPFERAWLKKIRAANPKMLVVHTQKGVEKRPMKAHKHDVEQDEQHKRQERDPHIWLSPPLVMLQARNILTGLIEIDPAHAPVYRTNYKGFIIELVDLDAELQSIFLGKEEVDRFMVFHPAWGYFADAYGLEQIPVQIEGKDPKPGQLQHLINKALKLGIKVIFIQPQFSTKSAQTIAKAIGAEVVFANPLAPDWPENLRNQATIFKAALR